MVRDTVIFKFEKRDFEYSVLFFRLRCGPRANTDTPRFRPGYFVVSPPPPHVVFVHPQTSQYQRSAEFCFCGLSTRNNREVREIISLQDSLSFLLNNNKKDNEFIISRYQGLFCLVWT